MCSKSPARESTTFILSHDRPGSELDVRIAVCDFAGSELWVHTEQEFLPVAIIMSIGICAVMAVSDCHRVFICTVLPSLPVVVRRVPKPRK